MVLTIKIALCLIFITTVSFHALFRNKNKIIWISACSMLFSIIYYLLYRNFSLTVFSLFMAVYLILFIASIADIMDLSINSYHLIFTGIFCILLRLFLDIPILSTVFSVLTAFLCLFLPYTLSGRKWVGFGDILIYTAISITLEPISVFFVLTLASILGLINYGIFALLKRRRRKLPFVPMLASALFFYYPFQDSIFQLLFPGN